MTMWVHIKAPGIDKEYDLDDTGDMKEVEGLSLFRMVTHLEEGQSIRIKCLERIDGDEVRE